MADEKNEVWLQGILGRDEKKKKKLSFAWPISHARAFQHQFYFVTKVKFYNVFMHYSVWYMCLFLELIMYIYFDILSSY